MVTVRRMREMPIAETSISMVEAILPVPALRAMHVRPEAAITASVAAATTVPVTTTMTAATISPVKTMVVTSNAVVTSSAITAGASRVTDRTKVATARVITAIKADRTLTRKAVTSPAVRKVVTSPVRMVVISPASKAAIREPTVTATSSAADKEVAIAPDSKVRAATRITALSNAVATMTLMPSIHKKSVWSIRKKIMTLRYPSA